MGVLPCDRDGCTSIMCDYFMYPNGNFYYICSECLTELERIKDTWKPDITRVEMANKIEEFMKKEVEFYRYDTENRDEMFKQFIQGRHTD